MRRTLWILLWTLLGSFALQAQEPGAEPRFARLQLKSGRVVEGKVVALDAGSGSITLQVPDAAGPVTYTEQDVDRILALGTHEAFINPIPARRIAASPLGESWLQEQDPPEPEATVQEDPEPDPARSEASEAEVPDMAPLAETHGTADGAPPPVPVRLLGSRYDGDDELPPSTVLEVMLRDYVWFAPASGPGRALTGFGFFLLLALLLHWSARMAAIDDAHLGKALGFAFGLAVPGAIHLCLPAGNMALIASWFLLDLGAWFFLVHRILHPRGAQSLIMLLCFALLALLCTAFLANARLVLQTTVEG